jgi:hypothetical protein
MRSREKNTKRGSTSGISRNDEDSVSGSDKADLEPSEESYKHEESDDSTASTAKNEQQKRTNLFSNNEQPGGLSEVAVKPIMEEYMLDCQASGLMDTEDDITDHYKLIVRKYGWKHFKVLTEDDYCFGSNFSLYICKKLKKDQAKIETRKWWDSIKVLIQRTMMDQRSACTQGMRRAFIGMYSVMYVPYFYLLLTYLFFRFI